MNNFFATFKNVGLSDIAMFLTEQERDDWVNFKDPYSKALGVDAENITFERVAMTAEEAEQRIGTMLHKKDEYNAGQEWYCVE